MFYEKKSEAEPGNFVEKETPAQMFSCEFCEISKKHLFCRTPLDDCFCPLGTTVFKATSRQPLKTVSSVIIQGIEIMGIKLRI